MTEIWPYIVIGLVVGGIYGLAAVGLSITYNVSRVFNFAHGAVGMLGAFMYYRLSQEWGWPRPLAFVVVLFVVAPLFGVALERLVFRRMADAPEATKIVATIGLMIALLGLALSVWGPANRQLRGLFPTRTFSVGGGLNVGLDQAFTFALTIVLAAALSIFLRRTRYGIIMRAVIDNRQLGELVAIDTNRITAIGWAMGSSFAVLAGILLAPVVALDPFILTFLVVEAYVAVMLGGLTGVFGALLGGLGLGLAESITAWLVPSTQTLQGVRASVPFVLLIGALLLPRMRRLAGGLEERLGRQSFSGIMADRPPTARGMVGFAVLFGAVALVVPSLSAYWSFTLGSILVFAMILLSLVLVTGLAGQISLCQWAFVGIGAFFTAHVGAGVWDAGSYTLAQDLQPLQLWVPIAAGLFTVPFGLLIGLPSLRLRGLFFALATLAFGLGADNLIFKVRTFTGGVNGMYVERPEFLGISFASDRAMVYLLLGVLLLLFLLVRNIRSGRTGRILMGVRDAELASQTSGVPTARFKLVAFALSAFIAGLAGSLYAVLVQQLSSEGFQSFQSLIFLGVAVVGGILSLGGSLAGAAVYVLTPEVLKSIDQVQLAPLLFGFGALLLARYPAGLAGAGTAFIHRVARLRPLPRPPEATSCTRLEERLAASRDGATPGEVFRVRLERRRAELGRSR